jgi:hypothetical protein
VTGQKWKKQSAAWVKVTLWHSMSQVVTMREMAGLEPFRTHLAFSQENQDFLINHGLLNRPEPDLLDSIRQR